MSTARPRRAELTVRDSIACIVTVRGPQATAEVIDYRGVGPSKYDCEDALYEARRWVRRNVRDADPMALFAPAWTQGEVAVFRHRRFTALVVTWCSAPMPFIARRTSPRLTPPCQPDVRDGGSIDRSSACPGSSVGRDAYEGCMTSSWLWEVSADEIEAWADGVSAFATLPKLVRRLLAATPLVELDMRADAGVRLGGYDGMVVARAGSQYCPPGVSVWEFSVKAKIKEKLDEDYTKRTDEMSQEETSKLAYVAVTARRYPNKLGWVHDKRRSGRWADVRLHDADDLAAWLEQAPAVGRWFAALLNRPMDDVIDVETYLDAWSRRTVPPLPPRLACLGRDRHANELRRRLAAPGPAAIQIAGDTHEEVLVFVAETLAGCAEASERERLLARALVVRSRSAWNWAVGGHLSAEPLILLPDFEEFDAGHVGQHAKVIVPYEGGASARFAICLPPIPWRRIEVELRGAGRSPQDAVRLAEESGGKLVALQRLCGHVEAPAWLRNLPRDATTRKALVAMLFAGAWLPNVPADGEALRLLGSNHEDVAALCSDLATAPDVAVRRHTDHWGASGWQWVSSQDAWSALASRVTDADLARFADAATKVLGTLDPAYELPAEQRFYAAVLGKSLPHSSALREGLASSLARLATADALLEPTLGASRGSEAAQSVVRRLLPVAWRAWASLGDLLPVLAEAAPDHVLVALESSLAAGAQGIEQVMREEVRVGHSPHVPVLWTLEMLGWHPRLMPRTALALARLAAHDPGGPLANRPLASLSALFHAGYPQTAAAASQRSVALTTVVTREPQVGWRVLVDLLEDMRGGILHEALRPSVRADWPLRPRGDAVPPEEAYASLQVVAELAAEQSGRDASRWEKLLATAGHLPPELDERLLAHFDAVAATLVDDELKVWGSLRKRLHQCLRQGDQTDELAVRLEALYRRLTPADPALRVAWLFRLHPDLPERIEGGWRAEETRADTLRREAVAAVVARNDRWDVLGRLAEHVERLGTLGELLASSEAADEFEERLLAGTLPPSLVKGAPAFCVSRMSSHGRAWFESVLRALADGGRFDEATGVALTAPPETWVWDVMESLGEEVRARYWRGFWRMFGEHTPEEWDRAVRSLLGCDRVANALVIASNAGAGLSPALAVEVLLRFLHAPPSEVEQLVREGMFDYHVERLFDAIDRDAALDEIRVAGLECAYLPALRNSARSARRLYDVLGRQPDCFVTFVAEAYAPAGATDAGADESEGKRRARATNYGLALTAWRGHPGQELPPEDRDAMLRTWAQQVLELAEQHDVVVAARRELARVLVRAPSADGAWPCPAARALLEASPSDELAVDIFRAERARRGGVRKNFAEGGAQEQAYVERYRLAAERLRAEWPKTGALLDQLEASYKREATREDAAARSARLTYGMDLEDPESPAS